MQITRGLSHDSNPFTTWCLWQHASAEPVRAGQAAWNQHHREQRVLHLMSLAAHVGLFAGGVLLGAGGATIWARRSPASSPQASPGVDNFAYTDGQGAFLFTCRGCASVSSECLRCTSFIRTSRTSCRLFPAASICDRLRSSYAASKLDSRAPDGRIHQATARHRCKSFTVDLCRGRATTSHVPSYK